MDEHQLRERIRSRLASGQLRPFEGMIVVPRTAANRPCAACGLLILPGDAAPFGEHYLDGEYHWFHLECQAIWEEEREREPAVGSRS